MKKNIGVLLAVLASALSCGLPGLVSSFLGIVLVMDDAHTPVLIAAGGAALFVAFLGLLSFVLVLFFVIKKSRDKREEISDKTGQVFEIDDEPIPPAE